MKNVLGADCFQIGLVRGITEAIGYISRIFSGFISDYFARRKIFVIIGYGASAISRPIFAMSHSIFGYASGQFIDRFSNGTRDAPRDALIADVTPHSVKGASFGLREAFARAGSVVGALLAIAAMVYTKDNYRLVYWISTIPVILAVTLLVVGVREPRLSRIRSKKNKANAKIRNKISLEDLKRLPMNYWLLMAIATIFMLSRFSEVFLILRCDNLGLAASFAPLALFYMSLAFAISSYITAIFMDKMDRRIFLWIGFVILMVSSLILAFTTHLTYAILGVFIYGLHMGTTQSVLSAMVADLAPKEIRATSFGIYSFISGVAVLISGITAGHISNKYGIDVAFLVGAGITALALILLFFLKPTTDQVARSPWKNI